MCRIISEGKGAGDQCIDYSIFRCVGSHVSMIQMGKGIIFFLECIIYILSTFLWVPYVHKLFYSRQHVSKVSQCVATHIRDAGQQNVANSTILVSILQENMI